MTIDRLQPFYRYGSKFNWLDFIVPRLPHRLRYVEPYGGSGAVLFSREPSEIEAFNDIDEEIINFFEVLRDSRDELIRLLEATPYHEKEFGAAVADSPDDPVERARQFFVISLMSYNAVGGEWAYSTSNPRAGKCMHTSRYESKLDALDDVAGRLRRVEFFCRDALDVVQKFDYDDCIQYLDPPYLLESRTGGEAYVYEMGRDEHREMLEVVARLDADVAISAYRNDLYDDVLGEWFVSESTAKTAASNADQERTEALYTNYDPEAVVSSNQSTLDELVAADGGEGE